MSSFVYFGILSFFFFFKCILSEPYEIRGKYFYDSVSNDQFFIRGVDYQPGGAQAVTAGSDPLSNIDICLRDIFLFQQLKINTIRVYSVDPSLNHDECMTALYMADINLILDVNTPLDGQYLNRYEPWTTYTPSYVEHILKVTKVFSGYPNTLAFFAGNEVVNDEKSAEVSPRYIKAVIRDMRNYIDAHVKRPIAVGYSGADALEYRTSLPEYLGCGNDGSQFYGLNSYQWCGKQTFESSGYNILVNDFQNFNQPLFFSEFGCNEVQPRAFQEIGALYSPQMTPVFSGGIIYEYSMEANNYGLVKIASDNSVTILQDFDTLKNEYNSVALPKGSPSIGNGGNNPPCQSASFYANINATSDIPPSQGSTYIKNDVQATVGKLVKLNKLATSYSIKNVDGSEIVNKAINVVSTLDSASVAAAADSESEKKSSGLRNAFIPSSGTMILVFAGMFCFKLLLK